MLLLFRRHGSPLSSFPADPAPSCPKGSLTFSLSLGSCRSASPSLPAFSFETSSISSFSDRSSCSFVAEVSSFCARDGFFPHPRRSPPSLRVLAHIVKSSSLACLGVFSFYIIIKRIFLVQFSWTLKPSYLAGFPPFFSTTERLSPNPPKRKLPPPPSFLVLSCHVSSPLPLRTTLPPPRSFEFQRRTFSPPGGRSFFPLRRASFRSLTLGS